MPAADPSTLWSRYQHLLSPEKTVLRLKALIGGPTTKTLFAAAMAATTTRAPDGKAWSLKALNRAGQHRCRQREQCRPQAGIAIPAPRRHRTNRPCPPENPAEQIASARA